MDKPSPRGSIRAKSTQEKLAQAQRLQAMQSPNSGVAMGLSSLVNNGTPMSAKPRYYRPVTKSATPVQTKPTVEGASPILDLRLRSPIVKGVISQFMDQMEITDYRQSGKVRFSAESLIFTVALSYLCGYRSACSMGNFWSCGANYLREVIPSFPRQPVSHDTIKRALENVIFDTFPLFYSRFITRLIYESLNDLHLQDRLGPDFAALFRASLQEQNQISDIEKEERKNTLHILQKQVYENVMSQPGMTELQSQIHMQQINRQLSMSYRPYRVAVYGCSPRLNKRSVDELDELRGKGAMLTLLRNFSFTGCALQIHFYVDDYNVQPPSNAQRKTL